MDDRSEDPGTDTGTDDEQQSGQVSEVSALGDGAEPIDPSDATAGHPIDSADGPDPEQAAATRPDAGSAGPDATADEIADAPDAPAREAREERGTRDSS